MMQVHEITDIVCHCLVVKRVAMRGFPVIALVNGVDLESRLRELPRLRLPVIEHAEQAVQDNQRMATVTVRFVVEVEHH